MKKILVAIDLQNDYTSGRLFGDDFNKDEIIDNIVDKIKNFDDGILYFTLDTHYDDYLNTYEGKRFPVKHCIYMSEGWILDKKIFDAVQECKIPPIYYKRTSYGCIDMIHDIVKFYNDWKDTDDIEIEFCGIAPEGSLLINALIVRGLCPEARIIVDSDCCFGFLRETTNYAYSIMDGAQIEVLGNYNKVIYDKVHNKFKTKFGLEDCLKNFGKSVDK